MYDTMKTIDGKLLYDIMHSWINVSNMMDQDISNIAFNFVYACWNCRKKAQKN